jgi:hypothetical protein
MLLHIRSEKSIPHSPCGGVRGSACATGVSYLSAVVSQEVQSVTALGEGRRQYGHQDQPVCIHGTKHYKVLEHEICVAHVNALPDHDRYTFDILYRAAWRRTVWDYSVSPLE